MTIFVFLALFGLFMTLISMHLYFELGQDFYRQKFLILAGAVNLVVFLSSAVVLAWSKTQ